MYKKQMRFKLELRGGTLDSYYVLSKDSTGKIDLKDIIIDLEVFSIYKGTNRFRELKYDEFLESKYSVYLILNKSKYKYFDIWFDFIEEYNIMQNFLKRPFVNFNPNERIKILEWKDLLI